MEKKIKLFPYNSITFLSKIIPDFTLNVQAVFEISYTQIRKENRLGKKELESFVKSILDFFKYTTLIWGSLMHYTCSDISRKIVKK